MKALWQLYATWLREAKCCRKELERIDTGDWPQDDDLIEEKYGRIAGRAEALERCARELEEILLDGNPALKEIGEDPHYCRGHCGEDIDEPQNPDEECEE